MVDNFLFSAVIGTVLGFLSGLGTGGGSLLVLWLTAVVGMEHSQARVINLLFFLPSAAISCFFRGKQGKLNFKNVSPAILAGCCSAAIFSMISQKLDVTLLRKLFGVLLLITGLRELLYRPRKAR